MFILYQFQNCRRKHHLLMKWNFFFCHQVLLLILISLTSSGLETLTVLCISRGESVPSSLKLGTYTYLSIYLYETEKLCFMLERRNTQSSITLLNHTDDSWGTIPSGGSLLGLLLKNCVNLHCLEWLSHFWIRMKKFNGDPYWTNFT